MLRRLALACLVGGWGCVPWVRVDAGGGRDASADDRPAVDDAPEVAADAAPIDAPAPDVAADAPAADAPAADAPAADAPVTCPAGLGDCDAVAANGCEADLGTDGRHCGACGRACGGGTRCVGAECRCPVGQASCGGSCRDLRSDPAHCGACDRACTGAQVCAAGECASTCAAGTTACAGVCRDLANDPRHCSACGRSCDVAHGVGGCRAGACGLAACDDGYGDCDGASANGCEVDLRASADDCGTCGRRCQFANAAAACAGGRCVMGACAPGYGDCNGSSADGCETNVASGDPARCGTCATRCPPSPVGTTAVCADSRCGLSAVDCPAGRRDCNAMAADGCEADVTASVDHCGACGLRCPRDGGTASCASGVCALACNAGLGDCDGVAANGCETSTRTSAAHCGACGRACSLPDAVAGCAAGACTITRCNEGYGDCDGNPANGCERNLGSDNASCGACGVACASGRVCAGGVCRLSCGTLTVCGDTCRDPRVDPDHCGGCGMACSASHLATRTCTAGACSGACAAGFADCDANKRTNGCETPVTADVRNCGGCGVTCPSGAHATATCAGGSCGLTCAANYGNCDGVAANGCETDLRTGANCGACGASCVLGLTCLSLGGGYRCVL